MLMAGGVQPLTTRNIPCSVTTVHEILGSPALSFQDHTGFVEGHSRDAPLTTSCCVQWAYSLEPVSTVLQPLTRDVTEVSTRAFAGSVSSDRRVFRI